MGISRIPAAGLLLLPLLFSSGSGAALAHGGEEHGGGGKGNSGTDTCVYTVHGSDAERAMNAKGGGAGSGGGGKQPACGKAFAKWTASSLDVYVDASGAPAGLDASLLDTATHLALTEWACHSGLGESIAINYVTSSAGAEITVGWGNLGTTGILGQTTTSYAGGVISHSAVVMNSNQGAFSWTAGPAPSTDADGCAVEVGNGNTATSNYDFLSVLTHEIGHALGIAHPNNQCRGNDPCYGETMYSCTDAEEYMRRALNAGDVKTIVASYGAQP